MNTPYEAGFDCGINGADTTNCNFRWFSTREDTKAWERGKSAAEAKASKRTKKKRA